MIRVLIALVYKLEIYKMNIKTILLNGKLEEEFI